MSRASSRASVRRRQATARAASRVPSRAAACEPLESRQMLAAIFGTSNTVTTSNNGGPVITNPHIVLIFWGANWNVPPQTPSPSACINAVGDIISGPYLRGLSGYGAFGNGNITNTYFVTDSS